MAERQVTALYEGLGHLVLPPLRAPWIPGPPTLDLDAPIAMPDVETLRRVIAGLRRL